MKGMDRFGRLVVQKLRDDPLRFAKHLHARRWKAPSLHALQQEFGALTKKEAALVQRVLDAALHRGIHAFLFSLAEEMEKGTIQVSVKEGALHELTDGLQGEPYGPDGWYERYSKFKTGLDRE